MLKNIIFTGLILTFLSADLCLADDSLAWNVEYSTEELVNTGVEATEPVHNITLKGDYRGQSISYTLKVTADNSIPGSRKIKVNIFDHRGQKLNSTYNPMNAPASRLLGRISDIYKLHSTGLYSQWDFISHIQSAETEYVKDMTKAVDSLLRDQLRATNADYMSGSTFGRTIKELIAGYFVKIVGYVAYIEIGYAGIHWLAETMSNFDPSHDLGSLIGVPMVFVIFHSIAKSMKDAGNESINKYSALVGETFAKWKERGFDVAVYNRLLSSSGKLSWTMKTLLPRSQQLATERTLIAGVMEVLNAETIYSVGGILGTCHMLFVR